MAGKLTPFQTFLHYSDLLAQLLWDSGHEAFRVWGTDGNWFANYSDRLETSEKWHEGFDLATKSDVPKDTARWYEVILNHFHGVEDVDMKYVGLGCNRNNGDSFLIFGYTYTPTPNEVAS